MEDRENWLIPPAMTYAERRLEPFVKKGKVLLDEVEALQLDVETIETIETRLDVLEAATDAYTPSNVTDTYSFDADSTTLAEVADVLGSLIETLQAKGILS